MTRFGTSVVLTATLALAGCGDPYSQPDQRRDSQPPPGEQPAPAVPKPSERVDADALARTPEQAARRAAKLTTNWTGENAASKYAQLARITVGAARRDARDTAARLPTDPQLSAPGARSTGTVESIESRASERGRRELVVVTRETVIADGLREKRWRVTLVTAQRVDAGWVLSRWEPQP